MNYGASQNAGRILLVIAILCFLPPITNLKAAPPEAAPYIKSARLLFKTAADYRSLATTEKTERRYFKLRALSSYLAGCYIGTDRYEHLSPQPELPELADCWRARAKLSGLNPTDRREVLNLVLSQTAAFGY